MVLVALHPWGAPRASCGCSNNPLQYLGYPRASQWGSTSVWLDLERFWWSCGCFHIDITTSQGGLLKLPRGGLTGSGVLPEPPVRGFIMPLPHLWGHLEPCSGKSGRTWRDSCGPECCSIVPPPPFWGGSSSSPGESHWVWLDLERFWLP